MSFKEKKKNVYVCEKCGHHLVTVDRDEGTTPFRTGCVAEGCDGIAVSKFYKVQEPLVATHEWYREKDDAPLLKHPASKWHHQHGGLFLRQKLKIVH